MEFFKIKLQGERACFTIWYESRYKYTYPLPPYSTVVGTLCASLRDKYLNSSELIEQLLALFRNGLGLFVACNHRKTLTHRVWMRSLGFSSKEEQRQERKIDKILRHSRVHDDGTLASFYNVYPVLHTELIDVTIILYIERNESSAELLDIISENISIIPIGRSEDKFSVIERDIITLSGDINPWNMSNNYYVWIPAPQYVSRILYTGNKLCEYEEMYSKVFNIQLLPFLWELKQVEKTASGYKVEKVKKSVPWSILLKENIVRDFVRIPTKVSSNSKLINEGYKLWFDYKENIPVMPLSFHDDGNFDAMGEGSA